MSKCMKLSEYFEKTQGIGVLATTDASGQVNQAIYGRPHFLDDDDDGYCSFIMSNRLSHDNVRHNPSASYLFIEEGEGYVGKRLSLTVIEEETDPEKIQAVRHRNIPKISEEEGKYLVHFHINGVRPLIGNEQPSGEMQCGKDDLRQAILDHLLNMFSLIPATVSALQQVAGEGGHPGMKSS